MNVKQKYQLWNYFFIAIFLVLTYLLISNARFITQLDLTTLLILSLATYRLTRLITSDKVLQHLRDNIKKRTNNSFFYTLNELQICPWCTSIWTALIVTSLYYLIPASYILLVLLAISAVATPIQLLIKKYS